ncbi:glutaredoxin family protein [Azoarcus indigens]|uniref:Thioredoxin reductase (NADPH) n=1 Tax=Azoarcus indigens TaxID=29545 RepID=A0A4R6ECB1_9RHOO|nr:glutaredoxin family protein [Azoarcus indigens]NMG64188.1 glutaredoxin family protein [Azoarcus indigens]TDN55783.1 thioredoxin reductase (NADPH) [Azoarcus indigens]
MKTPPTFIVLSREWCHLCHELVDELAPIAREFGWAVTVLDVDADPELEAKWDEAVPVLLHGEHELCRYRLDSEAVRAYCRAFPLESST